MRKFLFRSMVAVGLSVVMGFAQDQCKPIGWATKSGRTGGTVQVTGGGNATPIIVTSFADLQKHASGTDAKVIYIDGTLGDGWKGKTGDRLEIGSNKTIIGMKPGTVLKACIHINGGTNVILRNIVINGPGSDGLQSWDNINIEGSSKNIWVDHCEFWDGQDGNADVVKGADNVTFTWSIFGYRNGGPHNFSNLIASSDEEPVSVNKLNITVMFSWFRGINQRGPRCRYGNVHVANNLYTTDGLASQYAVSAGKDCSVLTENNHFIGTSSPIYTGHKSGTSAHTVTGNKFEGTSGNQTGYGTAFTPPYEYKSFLLSSDKVKAAVQAGAGATLSSPTTCNATPPPPHSSMTPTSSIVAVSSSAVKPSSSAVKPSSSAVNPSSSAVKPSSSASGVSSAAGGAPTVRFLAPTSGANLPAPATIQVEVEATDAGGTISNVKLFLNGTLVRQEGGAPYKWNDYSQDVVLQNMPAGTYTLKAVATDNSGATGEASMNLVVTTTTSIRIHSLLSKEHGNGLQYDLTGRVIRNSSTSVTTSGN